jgi:hypothetical protein
MAKVMQDMRFASSNGGQVTVSVALEPEVLDSLSRRGRRRLKDIQSTCQVTAKLDKMAGLLHISGHEEGVDSAKRLIVGLGGPRVAVNIAVWAELLRTRTLQEGSQAIMAKIQSESGCRIHIERSRHEVRLFGDREAVVAAHKLLEQLNGDCMEAAVPMTPESHMQSALHALAHECGVTLRLDETQVGVLGMRGAVCKAVKELERCLADPEALSHYHPPEETLENPQGALVNTPAHAGSNDDAGDIAAHRTACSKCGACPFCISCGEPTTFLPQGGACSACGACPFCTSCGHPTTFLPQGTSIATSPVSTVSQSPWIGQQLPAMDYGGGMMQIGTMFPQDMAQQGMVPAMCMIPEGMLTRDGMGQEHNMMHAHMEWRGS